MLALGGSPSMWDHGDGFLMSVHSTSVVETLYSII